MILRSFAHIAGPSDGLLNICKASGLIWRTGLRELHPSLFKEALGEVGAGLPGGLRSAGKLDFELGQCRK